MSESSQCKVELSLSPLHHERQKRQFCAKHAINNLLQLSNDCCSDSEIYPTLTIKKQYIVCHGAIYAHDIMHKVTVEECNSLADDFTSRESTILTDSKAKKVSKETSSQSSSLSLWKRLMSYHRTIWTGNYSFEVLEGLLLQRHVSLTFFTDIDSLESSLHSDDDDSSLTIGFIINSEHMLSPGRHWYAITRLRRFKKDDTMKYEKWIGTGAGGSTSSDIMLEVKDEVEEYDYYDPNHWYVINSSDQDIYILHNLDALFQYLQSAQNKKDTILRASLMHANHIHKCCSTTK